MCLNTLVFLKIIVLILSFYCLPILAMNKYNVSMSEMATCKEYDLHRTGYKYSDFFHVHTLDNNKIKNDEILHLKFYVKASMDAHILLSENDRPKLMDHVYEIVIGAGGNTFSAIRKNMGRRRVATNTDTNILSGTDYTPIEVVQMKDGNLLVYIPGYKEEPLLNYTDASALNIRYVSFSTFGSIEAHWLYDCKFDGFGDEIEQEQRYLSPRDQLLSNLTLWSENATIPGNLSSIKFDCEIHAVSYQHDTAILTTRLRLILAYKDKRLEWNPQKFGDIGTVLGDELNIWQPTLLVLNSALPKSFNFNLKVDFQGGVLLIAEELELKTWCFDTKRNWPNEVMNCEIALGLLEFDSVTGVGQLALEYAGMMLPLPQAEEISTYSEWSFEHLNIYKFVNGNVARFTPKGSMQTMNGDIAIGVTIARNRNFYKAVYTMPIFTAHSLIIMSFLLRGYRRGALTLVVFVILSLGLMYLSKHAVPAYVPSIMRAYEINMFISVYCYLLHIVIMWLEMYPPKSQPSACVMSIVNSNVLRLLLCMRFSDSTDYIDTQEYPWRQIAKILNNLSFAIVLVLLVILNIILLPHF